MGSTDLSDTVKLGLVLLIMVFTFGSGYQVFSAVQRPVMEIVNDQQETISSAATQTMIELCDVCEINGATLYTAMSQYGNELAGVRYYVGDDSSNYTDYMPGRENSIDDLLERIKSNGFQTEYHVFRNVEGVDEIYTVQTMFIAVKEVQ